MINREDKYINHFLNRKVKLTFKEKKYSIGVLRRNINKYQKTKIYLLECYDKKIEFSKTQVKKIEPWV